MYANQCALWLTVDHHAVYSSAAEVILNKVWEEVFERAREGPLKAQGPYGTRLKVSAQVR